MAEVDEKSDDMDVMEVPESKEMWVDKYEPKKLDDVVGQELVVSALKQMAATKLVTHMIFAGPPGVGKTTCAKCFANDALGSAAIDNFEVYNASSEDRGIDFVRKDLKDSASSKSVGAPFKIIFLDEADGMTSDAQNALRGTMKQYSSNAIFILACNYLNRIITPISRSRCSLFKFESIGKDDIIKRLKYILSNEETYLSPKVVEVIVEGTKGDLRWAINWLQVAEAQIKHGMAEEIVVHGFEVWRPVEVKTIILDALDGNLIKVRNAIDSFLMKGTSAQEILDAMSLEVMEVNLQPKFQGDILRMIAEASARINDGSPERIQFNSIFSTIAAAHFKTPVKEEGDNESKDSGDAMKFGAGFKPKPMVIKKT